MKVSIIIPAYNAEKWIKKCLDSILNQSYSILEIIVVNDGSTDGTLGILNRYSEKDKRLLVINKKNEGTYLARNEGVRKSTGSLIFHTDADDFLEPNAIELLVSRMKKENADLVIGNNYQLLNGKRKIITNRLPLKQNNVELLKSLLKNDIKGYIWGKLYKKELLLNLNYRFTKLLQEDVLFNLHVFINHNIKISLEPSPIYNYVLHNTSANSSTDPIFIENIYKFNLVTEKMLRKSKYLSELKEELKLFKCRNFIVYARLGGILAKDKDFRENFYRKNYTPFVKANLAFYHNLEMKAYNYHYDLGRIVTKSMKKINHLIF